MSTETTVDEAPTPGEQLRKARIGYGWSFEDVAANLNLDVDVVRALESGDYAGLPEPAFIRGYLRAYARLMEMDDVQVLSTEKPQVHARLGSVVPVMDSGELLNSGKRKSWPSFAQKQKSTHYRSIIIVLLAIAIILGAWWYSGIRLSSFIGGAENGTDSGPKTITVPLNSTATGG